MLISHNDTIELGNTKILCKDAPGHTPGTKAFFFDVTDGNQTLRAAMHGGLGANSMKKEFLNQYGLSTDIRDKFVPAIESFIEEPVDIFLGNHVWNNDTVGKSERMTESFNPFIDKTEWKTFLTKRIAEYYKMIDSEETI